MRLLSNKFWCHKINIKNTKKDKISLEINLIIGDTVFQ